MNVLISIGNSDDKLSQAEWSEFIYEVRRILNSYDRENALIIHGEWFSAPDSPYQNANWCVEFPPDGNTYGLRRNLTDLRKRYRQDSIAWTQGPVEFI